jgi:hypothetical protein
MPSLCYVVVVLRNGMMETRLIDPLLVPLLFEPGKIPEPSVAVDHPASMAHSHQQISRKRKEGWTADATHLFFSIVPT